MTEPHAILDDKREIDLISFNGEDGGHYSRHGGYVIEAYGEPQIHCDMPYFRVLKGGVVVARIPAWMVSVHYVQP